MRRKFLYFKIFDLKDHPKEIEVLSYLEISNIIGDIIPIDNIFQLSQQPEVKRIIENDLNLQNALTDSLPRRGRHGYLWVGDVLPDVVQALSRLSYIKEIFLFQQLLEPEPEFLKLKLKNMTFLEYNIHLWRVYKFWTFAYYLNRSRYISALSKNQTEMDEKFKTFREELHQPVSKSSEADPSEMLSFVQDHLLLNFNIDQRQPIKNTSFENRNFTALINSIADKQSGKIVNHFCGAGTILMEGTLFGYDFLGQDLNPVDQIFARINGSLLIIDPLQFYHMIPEMQSKLKMLMTASIATQTDLFLYSIEGQFLHFWENEKKRIKNIDMPDSISAISKFIAAIRFLVETKSVSKEEIHNQIFLATLINIIYQNLRKKENIDFYQEYHNALHEVFLKLYALYKIRSFYNHEYGSADIIAGNSLTCISNNVPVAGIISKLPAKIAKKGFDKDRLPISLLHLQGSVEKLEHQLLGSKYIFSKEELLVEIKSHSGFYEKLPKDCVDLLARLELMGKHEDVLRYFQLWKQYADYFKSASETLQKDSQLILLLEKTALKIDKTEFSLPYENIVCGIIENNEIKLKLNDTFTISSAVSKGTHHALTRVFIFQKTI